MLSLLIAVAGLGVLIMLHEGGHFLAARLCGMRVERFSIGFGPALASFKRGGTIFQIAPIPFGGFVQITGLNPNEEYDHNDPMVYPNRPRWMRFFTLVAGPLANYITASIIMLFVFTMLGVPLPSKTESVADVEPNSAAATAGLKAGDVIVEANGHKISVDHTVRDEITASAGAPLTLSLLRKGQPVSAIVTPKQKAPGQFQIGVYLDHSELAVLPFPSAAKQAVIYPYEKSKVFLDGIAKMITGREKAELSGPIGITRQIAHAADRGIWEYFGLIAMLSAYLGFINLVPLPALDGGRVAFLTVGALIRRQINPRIEAMVHSVGLLVLLGVMAIVSVKDVTHIFGQG